jgi:hypothetical protein
MEKIQNSFEGKLNHEYPELIKKMEEKKYILLIPKKKLITDSSILTKRLYYNHIYYIDKYNEHLYINLNGRVLKYDHPKLTTYLGWPKEMTLTVLDSYNSSSNILCFEIDNICDEIHYRMGQPISKDSQLKRFNTQKDYLHYYNNYMTINENYKKSVERLKKFTNEMKYNYILIKGQEEKFSKIFRERTLKLINRIRDNLSNPTDENVLVYDISSELVDSLVFNEIYTFLFEKLKKFYEKDEEEIKKKLSKKPMRYEWEGLKIEEIFNSCKFLNAIKRLDDISLYSTIFEKVKVLIDINTLITEEAKNFYESGNRGNFIPQGDLLLSFWIYVVAHCKTENIIAEAKFLSLFGVKGNNEDDYVKTTFISAVDTILMEMLQDKDNFSQHLDSNIVNLSYSSSLLKDKKINS